MAYAYRRDQAGGLTKAQGDANTDETVARFNAITAARGAANGIATLGSDGILSAAQRPAGAGGGGSGASLGSVPVVNNTAAISQVGYTARRLVASPHMGGSAGDVALAVDREYWVPFFVPFAGNVDAALVEVATAAAGALRLSLFAVGANGLPAALVGDLTGTAQINTGTTGSKLSVAGTGFAAFAVTVGWHYVQFLSNAAPSLRGLRPAFCPPFIGLDTTSGAIRNGIGLWRSGAYGAPPANAPTTGFNMLGATFGELPSVALGPA